MLVFSSYGHGEQLHRGPLTMRGGATIMRPQVHKCSHKPGFSTICCKRKSTTTTQVHEG